MSEEIRKYDEKGNLIYKRYSDGYEICYEYNKDNKQIHYKTSSGFESWSEYDINNNLVYSKNNEGSECWSKYDKENKHTYITKQKFENIKEKEYLSRKKCSRFELIDI